jgi:hypothetical protein
VAHVDLGLDGAIGRIQAADDFHVPQVLASRTGPTFEAVKVRGRASWRRAA